MECEEVKKENPDVKVTCCVSCHDDEDMGFGYDLWFVINGQERHVCCAVSRAFDKEDRY